MKKKEERVRTIGMTVCWWRGVELKRDELNPAELVSKTLFMRCNSVCMIRPV